MSHPVIVSVARTAIGKAGRGAFNMTHGATMGGHVARHAVDRAGIDPALIEDSIWGTGYPEYVTGGNIARQIVIRAGLPVSIAGTTVNRFCASGLQAIAMGGHMIAQEGAKAILVGGVESISMVQPPVRHSREDWILAEQAGPLHADGRNRRYRRRPLWRSAARRRTNWACKASSAPPRRRRRAASTTRSCR